MLTFTKSLFEAIEPDTIEKASDEELEESSSILDDIYDLAHGLFPNAVEKFQKNVGDTLERAANYMEEIGPSWEASCDRIYNKVINYLDGAEEKTLSTIDKLQHSPIGVAIDQIYEKNHRDIE